ncbi:MAG: hypothetical protein H3C47_00920 [Candidatus Cloacimonetes bacterium]|nr:hypothetical protein [Candidatus Cloacimonadota bacterium]
MKYFFLLCLILCKGFAQPILFVEPVLKDPSKVSSLRNTQKTEQNGLSYLLFQEASVSEEMQKIQEDFTVSPLLNFVLDLRTRAQKIAADLGHEVTLGSPLMIHYGLGLGAMGPAMASSMRMQVAPSNLKTSSLMVLSPLKHKSVELSIHDFARFKYLKAVIAHEIFHGIMGDLYGDEIFLVKASSTSNRGHDSHLVTDEFLAFLEGVAEAMEIAVARQFPEEVSQSFSDATGLNPSQAMLLQGFIKRRIRLAGENRFVFANDGASLDGMVDEPATLLKTEGNVASLFYRVMFRSGIEDSLQKCLVVLGHHKPHNMIEFMKAFAKMYPSDAKNVIRQFLESTYYVTVDPGAAELYKRSYLDSKAFKQGRIKKEDTFGSRDSWKSFKENLFESVLQGKLAIDNNLPSPYPISDTNQFFQLDLNTSDAQEIEDFLIDSFEQSNISEDPSLVVARIMSYRSKGVVIRDMDSVELPDSVESLLSSSHQNFVSAQEKLRQDRALRLRDSFYQGLVDWGSSGFFFHLGDTQE